MVIRNGSIYWVDFSPGKGSEPLGRRPGLVVQTDALNDSKLSTIIMLPSPPRLNLGNCQETLFCKRVRQTCRNDVL